MILMNTLIVDSNNLAYSGFYSFSELSHNEKPTGVIFLFLKRILLLAKKFETNKFIFCWDTKKNYRKVVYPEYKQNRRQDLTEQEKIDYALAFKQFDELRLKVLPDLGFNNVFWQNGYEADDLIAYIVLEKGEEYEGSYHVVSTDKDLYQLLDVCNIYNQRTKKVITKKVFVDKYDIPCKKWPKVKAMMGDASDNIKGIMGVGEVNALKYIHGELKSGKTLDKIIAGRETVNRNLRLIKLPFKSKKEIDIVPEEDLFDRKKFIDVFVNFGFESFLKKKELDSWVKIFCKERLYTRRERGGKMKKWNVWSEGYAATGESDGAMFHGTFEAPTFQEACDKCFKNEKTYNSKRRTLWGCQLFDNQVDAIKSFG